MVKLTFPFLKKSSKISLTASLITNNTHCGPIISKASPLKYVTMQSGKILSMPFGFASERTYVLRLDTIMEACAFHVLNNDILLEAAHAIAFPAVEGQDFPPEEDFNACFSTCAEFALTATHDVEHAQPPSCPQCQNDNELNAKYCQHCGIPMKIGDRNVASRSYGTLKDQSETAPESFTSQQEQMRIMQKLANELVSTFRSSCHLNQSDSHEAEDDDSIIQLVDGDKPVSRKELHAILAHHSYSLSSYAQRSLCQQAHCLELIFYMPTADPNRAKLIIMLSQSLRDTYISIYKPGAKPIHTEAVALSQALLPGRLTRAEIKELHAPKPTKQAIQAAATATATPQSTASQATATG